MRLKKINILFNHIHHWSGPVQSLNGNFCSTNGSGIFRLNRTRLTRNGIFKNPILFILMGQDKSKKQSLSCLVLTKTLAGSLADRFAEIFFQLIAKRPTAATVLYH